MLLYIMLAYLMLFAVLHIAVCLYNTLFIILLFANAFCLLLCSGKLTHSFLILGMIWHHASAIDLLVFPNSMFTPFLYILKGYVLSGEIAVKITIIIIIIIRWTQSGRVIIKRMSSSNEAPLEIEDIFFQ